MTATPEQVEHYQSLAREAERVDIRWDRGSIWTNFTRAEAASLIKCAVLGSGESGSIISRNDDYIRDELSFIGDILDEPTR